MSNSWRRALPLVALTALEIYDLALKERTAYRQQKAASAPK